MKAILIMALWGMIWWQVIMTETVVLKPQAMGDFPKILKMNAEDVWLYGTPNHSCGSIRYDMNTGATGNHELMVLY